MEFEDRVTALRRRFGPVVKLALTPELLRARREAHALGVQTWQLPLVHAWHFHMLPSLQLLHDGLVIDVGAHEGHWTEAVLEIAPRAQILAFEPQEVPRQAFVNRLGSDPRVTIDPRGVAGTEGTREMRVLSADVGSSFYSPHERLDDLYGSGWEETGAITVSTTTLDAAVGDREVAVLKVDVQGAEVEVLRGASQTLSRTAAVMVEVLFIHHYDGDATFATLHDLMRDAGFELTGFSPPALSPQGVLLHCDAFYVNRARLDPYFSER
jgi:FkbM family methyltransferase